MTLPEAGGDAASSYDEIPYDSHPFPFTTPEHLASIAGLFGFEAIDPARCRVLELGCAGGGNLLPMAARLPGSEFLGVDASARQVAAGQAEIEALGLTNLTLRCQDILELPLHGEPFDYVICHGVYSWVPPAVQAHILALCRHRTHPRSLAYVSYNVYPGWHLRGSVREMMNYHAQGFDSPRERIGQARALLNLLVEAAPADNAYGQLLRDELNVLRDRADAYLYHEHLEANNAPVYFHEFAARLEAAGLRYVGEASMQSMMAHGFPAEIRDTLLRIAPDLIRYEQYLDFLRNRTFRRTLMCHAEVELTREISAASLRDYRVWTTLRRHEPQPGEAVGEGQSYVHPTGLHATAHLPHEFAVLDALAAHAPASLSVDALAAHTAEVCGMTADQARSQVGVLVLECAANGLVELTRYADHFVTAAGPLPTTSALIRRQMTQGNAVTNLRHGHGEVPPFERALLTLLDGSRDRAALAAALQARVLEGSLNMYLQGAPLTEASKIAEVMPQAVELGLRRLAAQMLLVA